ncbi:hypothetical protein QUW15_05565, partial [Desulfovibrio piger]|nr:hypothetical protein [Desulfovibrio piger]
PPRSLLEHFQFETQRVSKHTAWRFAEKRIFFSRFWTDSAVPPLRVSPFFKLKGSIKKVREEFVCVTGGRLPGGTRRHSRIAASSRKKRVEEGWGAGGKENPCALAKGFPSPRYLI